MTTATPSRPRQKRNVAPRVSFAEGEKQARRRSTGPSEQTTIRFPVELLRKLRKIARNHNVSLGLVMTAILVKHVDEFDVPGPHSQPADPERE